VGSPSKFLSGGLEEDKKSYVRRDVRLVGAVFYLRKGLKDLRTQKALILNISPHGCAIRCTAAQAVDDHLYLVAPGLPKIACAVVRRVDRELDLTFTRVLPMETIDRLTVG
jgi:hypothetical protein